MANMDNLTMTTLSGIGMNAAAWTLGYGLTELSNSIFGHKDSLRFYYDYDSGGSVLQVIAKGVIGGAVSTLANMATNAFNGLLNGQLNDEVSSEFSKEWNKRINDALIDDASKYGMMVVKGGTVYALDEWGDIATEALMLSIETDSIIQITQTFPAYSGATGEERIPNKVITNSLVWYDTTAMVNISSDKNVITTRIQGRDYSRKELVSNGDIKFSVSGQISSGLPEVYPVAEVEKFFKIMQHKGIVKVNCQALNVLGVEQILITDFNLSAKEGSKSIQNYSFSGLGLQPANEIEISKDTVEIILPDKMKTGLGGGNPWVDMLENASKAAASDIFSRGMTMSTGMIMNAL